MCATLQSRMKSQQCQKRKRCKRNSYVCKSCHSSRAKSLRRDKSKDKQVKTLRVNTHSHWDRRFFGKHSKSEGERVNTHTLMQVKRENPDRCISPRGETKREHARKAKDFVIATQVAIYPRINMTISGVKTYDRIAPSLLPVRN